MMMLKINDLSVKLGMFELCNMNFSVADGEYFVLLGRSGAGKSVLLQLISGMVRADKGEIWLNGREISREKIQRRNVGMVFQDAALFPHMSVFNNIAYPLRSVKSNQAELERRIDELAGITSVSHLLRRFPGNLSGGEKQRVALARALALKPDCLLLDEPLSSMDIQLRSELRSILRQINGTGQTIVHVTHDYEEAALLAHRIGVIENGSVVQTGRAEEVFQKPRTEFVARFTGIRNFFSGVLTESRSSLKKFRTGGMELTLLSDEPHGSGFVIIRAEDIIVSSEEPESSAANNFRGKISDMAPARMGTELMVDFGIRAAVLVTDESITALGLRPGKEIWVSFKASALKFIMK